MIEALRTQGLCVRSVTCIPTPVLATMVKSRKQSRTTKSWFSKSKKKKSKTDSAPRQTEHRTETGKKKKGRKGKKKRSL